MLRLMRSVPADSDLAHERLVRIVAGCVLEPGSWTTTEELAGRLDVASPAARAAIERLVADGFLAPEDDGYRVRPMTAGEVTDVFDVMDLLVPSIIRRAYGRMPDEAIDEYEKALRDETGGRTGPVTPEGFVAVSRLWTTLMLDHCGSPRLQAAYRRLVVSLERCYVLAARQGPGATAALSEGFDDGLAWLRAGDVDGQLEQHLRFRARWRAAAVAAVPAPGAPG